MKTFNQLLGKEAEWLDKEGFMKEQLWIQEGIDIYREILKLEPENIHYRKVLAAYLVKNASDLKNRYGNYRDALVLIKEVLQLNPEDNEGIYHLGYIHFMNQEYSEALTHLTKALELKGLKKEQTIYALLASAVCYHKLNDDERANDCYEKAIEILAIAEEPDYKLSTLFQMTRAQLAEPAAQNKPVFVQSSEANSRYLSIRASHEIIERAEQGYFILDLRNIEPPSVYFQEKRVHVQLREAQVLKELMLSEAPKTPEVLRRAVWQDNGNPQIVKRYINSLRTKVSRCLGEPADEIIKTIPEQGYKWNSSKPFYILSIFHDEF